MDARFYHAGLEKAERTELEAWFLQSPDGVLCATCAYGMGLDKADVRTVVHYGPPASAEAYLQESGRAGRDGKAALAILIAPACSGRAAAAASSLKDSIPTELQAMAEARRLIMEEYASGNGGCRREFLLAAMGDSRSSEISCSGCDRCFHTAQEEAEGKQELLAALRRHARRFTERRLAQFLAGESGQPLRPGWGALGSWRLEELQEAIASLVKHQLVSKLKRGPWKNRLHLSKAGKLAQSGKSSSSAAGASLVTGGGAFCLRTRVGRARCDQGSAM